MRLIGICCLILALTACRGAGVGTVSGSKDAKVEELLTLMKIEQMQKQTMDNMQQMVSSQIKSQPGADTAAAAEKQKKVLDLIAQKTSWQSMKSDYIKVFSDTYNDSEIDGMLLFYRSSAGKAMVDKQPALMTKMMNVMQTKMADLAPELQKIMTE